VRAKRAPSTERAPLWVPEPRNVAR
jgi:hypothetical protein